MADMNDRITPTQFSRRSFVYREIADERAVFEDVGGAAMATHFSDQVEAERARRLGLADLSSMPRTGFKGPRAAAWLTSKSIHLSAKSNRAMASRDGTLTARLAPNEALILGDRFGKSQRPGKLERAWSIRVKGVYHVPRQDAVFWFLITGARAPEMFAKICGVDLCQRAFDNHDIAQTSIGRLNGIVIRDDIDAVLAFHLLSDSASAAFMWRVLLDAANEFDGGPVGLNALRQLRGTR